MADQYPIWVEVRSCAYNSGKSYGIKEDGVQQIHVGSSVKNSHLFGTVRITKSVREETIHFRYSLDGIILKEMIFEKTEKGLAGKLLKERTKLKSIKSLKDL